MYWSDGLVGQHMGVSASHLVRFRDKEGYQYPFLEGDPSMKWYSSPLCPYDILRGKSLLMGGGGAPFGGGGS